MYNGIYVSKMINGIKNEHRFAKWDGIAQLNEGDHQSISFLIQLHQICIILVSHYMDENMEYQIKPSSEFFINSTVHTKQLLTNKQMRLYAIIRM